MNKASTFYPVDLQWKYQEPGKYPGCEGAWEGNSVQLLVNSLAHPKVIYAEIGFNTVKQTEKKTQLKKKNTTKKKSDWLLGDTYTRLIERGLRSKNRTDI